MSAIRFSKVVSNLPQQLEPDTIYLVRTGNGFDLYCTDTTGSIAYQIGNAATATKLQTARTLTIGNTSKSFDGSADVSWSLAEIGVTAATETASGIVELATVAEARAAFDVARGCFGRVSFDLIYARQDQSREAWRRELREALSMAVDHLSLYQLTIEDGTVFGARHAGMTLSR